MTTMSRSYSEMITFKTFDERYDYLRLRASVGEATFGFDRWLNQQFYRSTQWKHIRNTVIARDLGLDLGVEGYEIHDRISIHHMNPMTADQVEIGDPNILNPEYLVVTSHNTHNAIHYGDKSLISQGPIRRTSGDTTLW